MPAAARVRDACTHASCESSCRWAKKATLARHAALQIGLVLRTRLWREQEVARLGKAGEGRLARVSELVLLRPCRLRLAVVVMGEAEDVTMPASA
jgi:hypothetical protein